MNKTVLAVLIVLAIGGIWYYMSRQGVTAPAAVETSQVESAQPADGVIVTAGVTTTVMYTKNGFSPATVKIKAGQSVTFVNQSGGRMWVASDPHPTHEKYSGTTRSAHCPDTANGAFDQCANGESYTFTFAKNGTWKYHNHALNGDTGAIIVE
ncbi:MAG: plastocyanin/azurin family copper-binding protein [Patescibacteria group bacterium]